MSNNKDNYRLCKADGQLGYFHGWEHYQDVIPPSPMMGGHLGGQISRLMAIVEYPDGTIHRVWPKSIVFCNDIHGFLAQMDAEMPKEPD